MESDRTRWINMQPLQSSGKLEPWSLGALESSEPGLSASQVLTEIGRNRLRVRQTQLSFAELEADGHGMGFPFETRQRKTDGIRCR